MINPYVNPCCNSLQELLSWSAELVHWISLLRVLWLSVQVFVTQPVHNFLHPAGRGKFYEHYWTKYLALGWVSQLNASVLSAKVICHDTHCHPLGSCSGGRVAACWATILPYWTLLGLNHMCCTVHSPQSNKEFPPVRHPFHAKL